MNPQNLEPMNFASMMRPVRIRLEQVSDWDSLLAEAGYTSKGLSAHCGYSIRTLQRFISSRYGESLLDFISWIRLDRARQLLKAGYSVKEVTHTLGYKQASHFARCFKSRFKVTPSEMVRCFQSATEQSREPVQMVMLNTSRAA
jgi:AraC-like DNA-binding protein